MVTRTPLAPVLADNGLGLSGMTALTGLLGGLSQLQHLDLSGTPLLRCARSLVADLADSRAVRSVQH